MPIGKSTIPTSALADYSAAIRVNPTHAAAYCGRGSIYSQKREFDKAIADYSEAIRLDPKDATAYFDRALTYEEQLRVGQGIKRPRRGHPTDAELAGLL